MKKHYHIEIDGTYSVLADSVEEAIEKVESWFDKAETMPYVGETDDNMNCDYCPIVKVDQKVHNHPLGTGFAHKDKKGDK
jgi:hypothetical protein